MDFERIINGDECDFINIDICERFCKGSVTPIDYFVTIRNPRTCQYVNEHLETDFKTRIPKSFGIEAYKKFHKGLKDLKLNAILRSKFIND